MRKFPVDKILSHLTEYEKTGHGVFSWPDDGLSREKWYYDFHCWWVGLWNKSNREKDAITFIKSLLTTDKEG